MPTAPAWVPREPASRVPSSRRRSLIGRSPVLVSSIVPSQRPVTAAAADDGPAGSMSAISRNARVCAAEGGFTRLAGTPLAAPTRRSASA